MAGRTDFNFSSTFELFTLVKNTSGLPMYLKINKENLKEEEKEPASETSIHFTWLLCRLQSSWLLSIDSPFSSKWSALGWGRHKCTSPKAERQTDRQTEESVREGGSERGSWCHHEPPHQGTGTVWREGMLSLGTPETRALEEGCLSGARWFSPPPSVSKELMLCGAGEDSWESLRQQGDQTSQS